MNPEKTGELIANLRRETGMTQKQLAEKLGVCAKTVSKWETGHGFPDISLITDISEILSVDILKLLSGEMPEGKPESGNMKKTCFYVCGICGNVLTASKNTEITCCGRRLAYLVPQEPDEAHRLQMEKMEEDFYITFSHPMTKDHYISFVSYVRSDRILTVKLYPEQGGEVRFPQMFGGELYYYCHRHGLFRIKPR